MNVQILLCSFFKVTNFYDIVSFLVSILALIIAVSGFLYRPRIRCKIFIEDDRFKVKLFNVNKFRKVINDIKCEMEVSIDDIKEKNEVFSGKVKTLRLKKDWIVCLLKMKTDDQPNYIFISEDPPMHNYNNLRVRFLIPNYIGVKKEYEYIISVEQLKHTLDTSFKIPTKPYWRTTTTNR